MLHVALASHLPSPSGGASGGASLGGSEADLDPSEASTEFHDAVLCLLLRCARRSPAEVAAAASKNVTESVRATTQPCTSFPLLNATRPAIPAIPANPEAQPA
eukprot:51553-Prorocentrum_minimum.AAC.2